MEGICMNQKRKNEEIRPWSRARWWNEWVVSPECELKETFELEEAEGKGKGRGGRGGGEYP